MRHTYIFNMDGFLCDIKDYLVRFTEYPNIRMTVIVQSVLDEICFVRGLPLEGYCSPIGEQLAIADLSEYDIPMDDCIAAVSYIKEKILETLVPVINPAVQYRLSYTQLNEFDYAVTIFYYSGLRYQYRPYETVYAC